MSFKQNRISKFRESTEEVIQVGGSNSNDTEGHASKRQRTENVKPVKMANSHLKGRKRFSADLTDMKEECKDGFYVRCPGMSARCFRAGDDEGSMEFKIVDEEVHDIVTVNLLVSDTSEYPHHHTYFSFSPDAEVPPHIQEVIEGISMGQSLPIVDAIKKLLNDLQKAVNTMAGPSGLESHEMDEEESDDDEYDAYDAYDNFEMSSLGSSIKQMSALKKDFIETVAAGYRPGHIGFGADDFGISVSLPIKTLAECIPPGALMAWDRHLLSRTQHLTLFISGLRGTYPPIGADGTYTMDAVRHGAGPRFKVGLGGRYKPGKEEAVIAARTFGWIGHDAEDEVLKQKQMAAEMAEAPAMECPVEGKGEEDVDIDDPGRFDGFSLSSSLESLMDQALLKLIQLRRKFGLGWAGAETLFSEIEKSQKRPEDIFEEKKRELSHADKGEAKLAQTYNLPPDPLLGQDPGTDINLPLTAFCYLVRRLTLCTRYCLVCHNPVNKDFEALKPYVCDSKLCAYQYYLLNRGPSLEYEIQANPVAVDLLVSFAYAAAAEKVLDEPLPTGMGLRVRIPEKASSSKVVQVGSDGLCDFDDLDIHQMRQAVAELIDSLPSIEEMKKHLERKTKAGKSKPRLKDMDAAILPSAWSILRWCVASCTAYLEEIQTGEERVRNIEHTWKQFRFRVGAPDAEAKFETAIAEAQKTDRNARKYPSLYAFHGSPLKNWHSIIRHGLWYKTVVNGRSFGNGVYLAKDGSISMGHYASACQTVWRNSKITPNNCVALAEIVNLPSQFVSSEPYFVVGNTHWIMCRYLLVRGGGETTIGDTPAEQAQEPTIPLVTLDPAHPLKLMSNHTCKTIEIPQPSYQLEKLLAARQAEFLDEDPDEEDVAVFEANENQTQSSQKQREVIDIDSDDDVGQSKTSGARRQRGDSDWTHDATWVMESVVNVMPPPLEWTPSATMAVQRELRAMLREQKAAASLSELGWYLPPEQVGDNLFQWIVELHSFDAELPIAKDMKAKQIRSIIFEIRFPPSFPLAPPFFRIITPRFLPFIEGGGGHVTGGGSICMDLLTSDGWLPSYSISAILLQIKLAISNLDPRPARLARNWDKAYQVHEALEGYKRAANAHGWKIPEGIERLVK